MERLIARPMPEPCGLVVKKALKIWSAFSAGNPTPVSLTEIISRPSWSSCDLTVSAEALAIADSGPAGKESALRTMRARHTVLLTPPKSSHPSELLSVPKSLTYDACHDLSSRSVLLQKSSQSLRPAVQILRPAERNDHREDFFRRRRHHGPFRIARRAAVRAGGIGEQRQSFQIQLVLADALVRFAGNSRAKDNFSRHMSQVIQPNRQAAFHRHEIDRVHHGVDLWQAFPRHHSS